MTANFINMFTVILGSIIGMLIKKGIPERISSAVMTGIGICTVYIGYTGAMCGENVLITIASMILGSIIGTLIDIDKKISTIGEKLEQRFSKNSEKGLIAKGFVTASLLFCVGSMTITGALQAGISGKTDLIITKSMLDLMSSMMLSSSLGFGVLLSSVFVLVFQGALTLTAEFIAPFLTTGAINELNCAGSLITLMLGFNLMGISKIKVANYLPAIIIAPIIYNLIPYFNKILQYIF